MGALVPRGQALPAGQVVQDEAPAAEYDPAGQAYGKLVPEAHAYP